MLIVSYKYDIYFQLTVLLGKIPETNQIGQILKIFLAFLKTLQVRVVKRNGLKLIQLRKVGRAVSTQHLFGDPSKTKIRNSF